LLPILLLQPIVENAIQHGIEPHARPGRIELKSVRVDNSLQVEVCDNGEGLPADGKAEEGIGLSNSRSRLQQLYGNQARFELKNAPNGGLRVTIVVPWRTIPSAKQNLQLAT
jgi:LytS/YehU family sensor histidine kinase